MNFIKIIFDLLLSIFGGKKKMIKFIILIVEFLKIVIFLFLLELILLLELEV